MTKAPSPPSPAPRLCPTCGTRVGPAATRCLVCGTDLTAGAAHSGRGRLAGRPRLGLALVGLILVLLAAGVALLAAALTGNLPFLPQPTPTQTATSTLPPTFTPTTTPTETQQPTPTPLPPLDYTVVAGDTCIKIALQFNVSTQSIIELNGLDPNCILSVGRDLKIPQPTPTPTALPSATLPAALNTPVPRATYVVFAGDTLLTIANFYKIPLDGLMQANGITDPSNIRAGQVLIIPLELAVTPGPTPTPSPPPPYPAPVQLLPDDGQGFTAADATITLQWTAVGELRSDERYAVAVEDITCQCARFFRQTTSETRVIVPSDFRPADAGVHLYRWNVTTVRERRSPDGQTALESAGATSPDRVFSWYGGGTPAP